MKRSLREEGCAGCAGGREGGTQARKEWGGKDKELRESCGRGGVGGVVGIGEERKEADERGGVVVCGAREVRGG